MLRFVVLAFVFIFSSCTNVSAEQLIRVNNMTGREICEFYISAHNEEDWGDDAFESLDRCVRHNEYADVTWNDTWTDTSYDIRVVFRNGNSFEVEDIRPNVTSNGRTQFTIWPPNE